MLRNVIRIRYTGHMPTNCTAFEILPELEFLGPLKLPVSMKPGVSLIGNAMKTKS
jgi:hypothetical protein